ncbi:MAG: pyridoxal phosphate-dependent aminotransferase [Pseudomonadota bacterium]
MSVSKNIEQIMMSSSWIRRMFEEGARLKAKHGSEKVFDFSLGNPNLEPPKEFKDALLEVVQASTPGGHAYMPNAGYSATRRMVAQFLAGEQGSLITEHDIIMTCGAAAGLNLVFKTILNPGENVIVPAPYFVEYSFYVSNHGGTLVPVQTEPDFDLDIEAVEAACTEKTRALLINSPNNPTGKIYSKEGLESLAAMLLKKSKEFGRTIYLVSDEPYRKIVFDNRVVPGVLPIYSDSIVVTSYSKDLSIPGERIGFVVVSPRSEYRETLAAGLTLANRILGFVNAPALMQRVIAKLQGIGVDPKVYQEKRDLLSNALHDYGYCFEKPEGAFYLFPKTPIPDDVAFVRALQEELILTVPGSGFGCPGYFRIAYCVDNETIIRALPGFRRTMAKFK